MAIIIVHTCSNTIVYVKRVGARCVDRKPNDGLELKSRNCSELMADLTCRNTLNPIRSLQSNDTSTNAYAEAKAQTIAIAVDIRAFGLSVCL